MRIVNIHSAKAKLSLLAGLPYQFCQFGFLRSAKALGPSM
jgi:hypothetical protein